MPEDLNPGFLERQFDELRRPYTPEEFAALNLNDGPFPSTYRLMATLSAVWSNGPQPQPEVVVPLADTPNLDRVESAIQRAKLSLDKAAALTQELLNIFTPPDRPADPDEHPCDEALGDIHEAAIFLSTRGWPDLAMKLAKAHEDIQQYLIRLAEV